jgi:DeoR/GlpR family transcriptional regulator of sugar metabolism
MPSLCNFTGGAIARAAAKLVRPGQVVILDGGTTTLQVVRHLPLDLEATIVTNSPPIAIALAGSFIRRRW